MRPAWRAAVGLLLALPVVALGVAVVVTPHDAAPQPTAYQDGGQNFTSARKALQGMGLPVQAVVGTISLAPPGSLLIIPAADRAWTGAQVSALERHLESGGSAWIAGGGTLSAWLAERGAAPSSQPLLQAGAAVAGQVVLQGTIGESRFGVASILPSTFLLKQDAGWEPWLTAPEDTHVDLDGDGKIGQGDPPGPFVVGAALRLPAGGTLVVTADHTLLADDSWSVPTADNEAFLRGVVQHVLPTSIVWDESEQGWTAKEAPIASTVAFLAGAKALPLWMSAALAIPSAAFVIGLSRQVPAINAFGRHRPQEVEQSAEHEAPDIQAIAWELLAEATGRPIIELHAAGPEAARGLADDPHLRRVLLGQGSQADRDHVLHAFTINKELQS